MRGRVEDWRTYGALVYSPLALALSAGSAFKGGTLILVFGLGIPPALLTIVLIASGWHGWCATSGYSVRLAH